MEHMFSTIQSSSPHLQDDYFTVKDLVIACKENCTYFSHISSFWIKITFYLLILAITLSSLLYPAVTQATLVDATFTVSTKILRCESDSYTPTGANEHLLGWSQATHTYTHGRVEGYVDTAKVDDDWGYMFYDSITTYTAYASAEAFGEATAGFAGIGCNDVDVWFHARSITSAVDERDIAQNYSTFAAFWDPLPSWADVKFGPMTIDYDAELIGENTEALFEILIGTESVFKLDLGGTQQTSAANIVLDAFDTNASSMHFKLYTRTGKIPEPETFLLFIAGFVGVCAIRIWPQNNRNVQTYN